MVVTREEMTRTRVRLLREMDEYVRSHIGDEIITCNLWLSTGVPDGADNQDFRDIASDDELWLDCVKTFAKCVGMGEAQLLSFLCNFTY